MDTIESSFCFRYLTKCIALRRSTIEVLVDNDYDDIHSLMAFDLDIDLRQLPNVSMGQKSILREALIQLKKEFSAWVESEAKNNSKSAIYKTDLNSTPVTKAKEYVSNDKLFKEFITTTVMDITDESISVPSFQQHFSSYADKQSVDRGINGTNSEAINLSLIKSFASDGNEINKTIENKSKRKRKKFLYSMKTSRNRNTPPIKPLSETKSNCDRKVLIDIDLHSKDSVEEYIETQVIGEDKPNVEPMVNSKTTQLKSKETNCEDNINWKIMKPIIMNLLKNNSKEIKLKKELSLTNNMHKFFKLVEFKGKFTPFVVCNICFDLKNFGLLMTTNSGALKSHLISKRHQNDPSILELGFETPKSKPSVDSDLSAEEFNSEMDINSEVDKQIVGINGTPAKSLKELTKLVSNPDIFVTKINITFDETNNKYLAKLLDKESENSQIVINNYDEVFNTNKMAKNKVLDKPYKCVVEGCSSAFSYPFSLEQHMVRHQKKSPIKKVTNSGLKFIKTTPKNRSSSLLHGMNNYIINYLNNNTSTQDLVLQSEDLNVSPFVRQSPISKSDCRLFRPNIECIFNNTNDQNIDNNINDKIVTKIKEWFKTTTD